MRQIAEKKPKITTTKTTPNTKQTTQTIQTENSKLKKKSMFPVRVGS